MRFSKTLIPTTRETPKNISDPAVARLARAGYIIPDQDRRTVSLLPMGVLLWERVISGVADLAREAGFQIVGFEDLAGDALAVSQKLVKSYRQLPLSFLGGDIRRVDAAGFAADLDSAFTARDAFLEIAREIAGMAGLAAYSGETTGGARKYVSLPCEKGSWHAASGFICSSCQWCGDEASPSPSPEPYREEEAPLQEVETPGADTIVELCRQLDIAPARTLKTMFYAAETPGNKEIVVVLARGDHQINDRKLSHVLGSAVVRFADPLEIREAVGDLAGYLGPVGLSSGIRVFADLHVEGCRNLVVGANKPDFHLLNACWGRDFKAGRVVDIVSLQEDIPCPDCGSAVLPAHLARISVAGVEPEVSGLTFQGDGGAPRAAFRWDGNLCLNILIFAMTRAEGFPARFAPFDVNVVIASMKNDDAVALGHTLLERLEARGLRVLLDDREERAGVKFSDAELLGIPVTVIAGREASEGIVETWLPDGSRSELPADAVIEHAIRLIQ